MTTPTTTPVPSTSPFDLLFNAEKIDEAVNSAAQQYVDRLGVARRTLAGAMASISAVNPRGAWTTTTVYAPRDVVSNSGTWYIALDSHTSGATFAGDTAAHWRVFQGVVSSDLASTADAAKGAKMVGVYDATNLFAGSTVEDVLTEVALKRYAVSPLEPRFGAVGNNSTDDQAALNACAAHCTTNGYVMYVPPLIYRISATVIFENCHVIADGAEFRADAAVTTGVQVGTTGTIFVQSIRGLRVRGQGQATQAASSVAWRFLNASQAEFQRLEAQRFTYGFGVIPADGTRVAYCTFMHPYGHRCLQNFRIFVDTTTGYAAENTVIAGRLQRAPAPDDSDYHVYAEKTSGSGSINHWRWWGTSMESSPAATQPQSAMRMRRVDYWDIKNVRTEGAWAASDFEFDANSTDNRLELLYDDSDGVKVVDSNGTNVIAWQRTEGLGGFDDTDPSSACIKRFYRNGTARVQVISDGTALPGVSLGSLANESAVELVWVPESSSIGLRVGGTLKTEATATAWRPATDNTISNGEAARRWSVVYAGTGTINTSDERAKRDIEEIPDAWLDAWAEVDFVRFKFRDAAQSKGPGARWHVGVIAQRVEDAFKAHGLDAFELGLLCWDEWPEQAEVRDSEGVVVVPFSPAGNRYAIRYDEAQILEAALMRRELKRLRQSHAGEPKS